MRLATIAAASLAFLAAAACKPSRPRSPAPEPAPRGRSPSTAASLNILRATCPRPACAGSGCRRAARSPAQAAELLQHRADGAGRELHRRAARQGQEGRARAGHGRAPPEASSCACGCTRSATASWSVRADPSRYDYPGSAWVVCLPSSRLTESSPPTTTPIACRGAIRRGATAHVAIPLVPALAPPAPARGDRRLVSGLRRRRRAAAALTEPTGPPGRHQHERRRAGPGRLHPVGGRRGERRDRTGGTAHDRRARVGSASDCAEWCVGELRGAGQNPRAVSVVAGQTVSETFAIVCTQPPPVTGG